MFCIECGASASDQAKFCHVCGYQFNLELMSKLINVNDDFQPDVVSNFYLDEVVLKSDFFDALIEKNTDYYRKNFLAIAPYMSRALALDLTPRSKRFSSEFRRENNEITSKIFSLSGFNWAALLLGPAWFAYRRMNKIAIGVLIYFSVLSGLTSYFQPLYTNYQGLNLMLRGDKVLWVGCALLFLISFVLIGFLANFIYLKYLNTKAKSGLNLENLKKYSGVNLSQLFFFLLMEFILFEKADEFAAIFRSF